MEPKTPYRTPARLVRGSHFLHDAPFVRDRRTEVVRDVQRDGKMGHLLAAKGAYQQMAPPVYGSTWSHRGHGRVRWRGPKAKARYLDFQHEHRQSKPKNRKQMAAELVKAINELASSFRQADANADSTLTFDEFRELPLPKGQTEETARMWFETLDADNDGTVSMVEFFFFAMREAALASGQGDAMGGLKQFFQGWDRKEAFTRGFVSGDPRYEGGDGKLDRDEFNTLAAGLGFGAVATQLLEAIDTDGSGYVEYNELEHQMRLRAGNTKSGGMMMAQARFDKERRLAREREREERRLEQEERERMQRVGRRTSRTLADVAAAASPGRAATPPSPFAPRPPTADAPTRSQRRPQRRPGSAPLHSPRQAAQPAGQYSPRYPPGGPRPVKPFGAATYSAAVATVPLPTRLSTPPALPPKPPTPTHAPIVIADELSRGALTPPQPAYEVSQTPLGRGADGNALDFAAWDRGVLSEWEARRAHELELSSRRRINPSPDRPQPEADAEEGGGAGGGEEEGSSTSRRSTPRSKARWNQHNPIGPLPMSRPESRPASSQAARGGARPSSARASPRAPSAPPEPAAERPAAERPAAERPTVLTRPSVLARQAAERPSTAPTRPAHRAVHPRSPRTPREGAAREGAAREGAADPSASVTHTLRSAAAAAAAAGLEAEGAMYTVRRRAEYTRKLDRHSAIKVQARANVLRVESERRVAERKAGRTWKEGQKIERQKELEDERADAVDAHVNAIMQLRLERMGIGESVFPEWQGRKAKPPPSQLLPQPDGHDAPPGGAAAEEGSASASGSGPAFLGKQQTMPELLRGGSSAREETDAAEERASSRAKAWQEAAARAAVPGGKSVMPAWKKALTRMLTKLDEEELMEAEAEAEAEPEAAANAKSARDVLDPPLRPGVYKLNERPSGLTPSPERPHARWTLASPSPSRASRRLSLSLVGIGYDE